MDFVLPVLEVDFIGLDLEQFQLPLFFKLVSCTATAHTAE